MKWIGAAVAGAFDTARLGIYGAADCRIIRHIDDLRRGDWYTIGLMAEFLNSVDNAETAE